VWIYCAVTWGFLFGFFLGWIPALILALVIAVATIYLWPLLAAVLLYVLYRIFGFYPGIVDLHRGLYWHPRHRNDLVVAFGSAQQTTLKIKVSRRAGAVACRCGRVVLAVPDLGSAFCTRVQLLSVKQERCSVRSG
jgi:hypothetical protein